MGQVYTFASGKGGVGKTTVVANVGLALAQMGHRVAVVDTDIGLRNLDLALGLENRIVYNLVDVIKGRCQLRQAMVKDRRTEDLALLPCAQAEEKGVVTPEQVAKVVRELAETYDYVLVDAPAGIEQGFENAMAGAHEVILVVNPEPSSVRDGDRVIGLSEAKYGIQPGLLINRMRYDMAKRKDLMSVKQVQELLGIPLVGIVPNDEDIIVATNKGEPIVTSPNSKTGEALRAVARRITGEEVPLETEPDEPATSMFARLVAKILGR